MNNELQTLSKLFSERLLRTPDYQRGYAWTKRQIEDFWSDISQINAGENHYAGVLTLEEVPNDALETWTEDNWIIKHKNFDAFYIVDGQQRLTTSIILIQCICEKMLDSDQLNYTTKTEIQKQYLFDSKDGGLSRSYIFGYEKDNPSYEYLKTKIFCEKSATDINEETVYTNNLMNAKLYFADKINNFEKEVLEELYTKITQRLIFNVFSISDEVDVYVAFETMNNRGRPLTHLELLKNRLIYLSTKLHVEDYEIRKIRATINDCWKVIYHNLGRNKNKPLDDDFFLRCHHFLNFIDSTSSIESNEDEDKFSHLSSISSAASEPLYRGLLNNIFTLQALSESRTSNTAADKELSQRIFDYSMSLQEAVKNWHIIFNPNQSFLQNEIDFWLQKLLKISPQPYYIIILSVMISENDDSKKCEALKHLERLIFIERFISSIYRGFGTRPEILDLAIQLNEKTCEIEILIETIKKSADTIAFSPGGKRAIIDSLKIRNFYTWRAIHYFLYEYNLFLQIHSKTECKKIDWSIFIENEKDYNSIEHIYPQKAMTLYWRDNFKGLKQSQREILKNVIGNLLPLSKQKNSSLSNYSFDDKVDSKNHGVGYAFGSYAENEICVLYDRWNPQAILDRSLRMLDFMEKRWDVSFGSDRDKIRLLSLEFVKPNERMHAKLPMFNKK